MRRRSPERDGENERDGHRVVWERRDFCLLVRTLYGRIYIISYSWFMVVIHNAKRTRRGQTDDLALHPPSSFWSSSSSSLAYGPPRRGLCRCYYYTIVIIINNIAADTCDYTQALIYYYVSRIVTYIDNENEIFYPPSRYILNAPASHCQPMYFTRQEATARTIRLGFRHIIMLDSA